MNSFLVVGGFEPSGHDSTAEAVIAAGKAAGKSVDYLLWRETVDLADHPMFVSHRLAAARGSHAIAGMLDEEWIGTTLSEDLSTYVDTTYDVILCVHPWSSLIVANALSNAGNKTSILIDYHSDFGAFPVVTHPRIDAYLGGGTIRALDPYIRSSCHVVGVAIPERFSAPNDTSELQERKNRLIVSAGSDGWAIQSMSGSVKTLAHSLKPEETILLAPNSAAEQIWNAQEIENATITVGLTDIAPLLISSRWYLSKGGGTAVGEGLAAGCGNFVSYSGIFWEDEAAQTLHAKGIAQLVDVESTIIFNASISNAAIKEREKCINAGNLIWQKISTGLPRSFDCHEKSTLDYLIKNLNQYQKSILPRTSIALNRRLTAWHDGWRK